MEPHINHRTVMPSIPSMIILSLLAILVVPPLLIVSGICWLYSKIITK